MSTHDEYNCFRRLRRLGLGPVKAHYTYQVIAGTVDNGERLDIDSLIVLDKCCARTKQNTVVHYDIIDRRGDRVTCAAFV